MLTSNPLLPHSIFFGSLLIAGATVFTAVAAFQIDWFQPAMIMIVAGAIGWDQFVNGRASNTFDKADEVELVPDFKIDAATQYLVESRAEMELTRVFSPRLFEGEMFEPRTLVIEQPKEAAFLKYEDKAFH